MKDLIIEVEKELKELKKQVKGLVIKYDKKPNEKLIKEIYLIRGKIQAFEYVLYS